MRGYPQFSFWISITPVKIYTSCIITQQGKKYLKLVGTVLNAGVESCECLISVLEMNVRPNLAFNTVVLVTLV